MSPPEPEPTITINGVELSEGQALTLRVALATFLMHLQDPEWAAGLGDAAELYGRRAREVRDLMAPLVLS